ncbi:unnamed protein product [Pleuronectes platessa]|uniref:Uncharacterized protein n=1 Tax=Pleuronectes platessa TaxID=8262 RepID=A0A9N7UP68_PLEPL|nr:unnamed protein product [Pleuronectes platessa]
MPESVSLDILWNFSRSLSVNCPEETHRLQKVNNKLMRSCDELLSSSAPGCVHNTHLNNAANEPNKQAEKSIKTATRWLSGGNTPRPPALGGKSIEPSLLSQIPLRMKDDEMMKNKKQERNMKEFSSCGHVDMMFHQSEGQGEEIRILLLEVYWAQHGDHTVVDPELTGHMSHQDWEPLTQLV